VEWKRQGPPDRIKVATKSYRSDNDTVGQFIEACCIQEPTGRSTARELYEAYKTWCFGSGLEPISNVCFGKELKRQGFKSIKARSGNAWGGLKLQISGDDQHFE
jgi:putative DNA primase/helicase